MTKILYGLTKSLKALVYTALALVILAACDDAEERAEKHYQNALALVAAGDYQRASVEFRNVFKLDVSHTDARIAYASMQRDAGDYAESVGQYLRILEQNPDDRSSRVAVVEMLAQLAIWEELEKQTSVGLERFPSEKAFQHLAAVAGYRLAVIDRNPESAGEYADQIARMLETDAENIPMRRVMIDNAMRRGRMEEALIHIDIGLMHVEDEHSLLPARLSVLAALGDTFEMEEQLRATVQKYPENDEDWMTLVRFLVSQKRIDDAEATLREYVLQSGDGAEAQKILIEFLLEFRSAETALAELDQLISRGAADANLLQMRATIVFSSGDTEDAIAQMERVVEGIDDNAENREFRVVLARMLQLSGEQARARSIVEEVISEDNAHVEARKMQAEWLVSEDQTGDAIAALRIALEQDPTDPQIFALLARAHQRDGNDELVGEMLSLGVEASDNAAEPSARYGQYLLARGKLGPAETVIIEALRRDPTDTVLLTLLGRTYLGLREWGRMEQVISTLRNFDEAGASAQADVLTAEMLHQQQRAQETVAFLERLVAQGGSSLINADSAIVRAHLSHDSPERALEFLEQQIAERPDEIPLRALQAATLASTGNLPMAADAYQELTTQDPDNVGHWTGRYRVLFQLGRTDEAEIVLKEGLEKATDPSTLQWILASSLERAGDLRGAVEIYETLYAANSDNAIIANNLANLLVTIDTGPETVARAYIIARRLASSTLPPYQDTYGWIAVLRGDFADAIRALEPAAAAMPQEIKTQYHLARAYMGANLVDKAKAQFEIVLELASEDSDTDIVIDSRAQLEAIAQDNAATAEPVLGE